MARTGQTIPIEADEQTAAAEAVLEAPASLGLDRSEQTAVPAEGGEHRTLRQFLTAHKRAVILVAAFGLLLFAYVHQVHATNALKHQNAVLQASPALNAQQQAIDLRNKVDRLVELSTNEVPTVATVTDAGVLKKQSFFQDAQNGDKLLMFNDTDLAVLYRPADNKIIQMAHVSLSAGDSDGTTAATGAGN